MSSSVYGTFDQDQQQQQQQEQRNNHYSSSNIDDRGLRKRNLSRPTAESSTTNFGSNMNSPMNNNNNDNNNNENNNNLLDNNNDSIQQQQQQPLRTLDEFLETAYNKPSSSSSSSSSATSTMNDISWKYWFVMLSLGVANSSDATEILCLSYILSDKSFDEHILHSSTFKGGILASTVFFGMLLGGLFLGTLSDWVGRKPILFYGLLCNAIAGILSSVASNVWVLSFLRCIAGIGIGTSIPPLFTLVTELAPPTKRGFFITICASFWMVGSIYVAIVALYVFEYWSLSWRIFALLCALPSALGSILIYTIVPESPRFLALMKHNHHESLKVITTLATYLNYNGRNYTLYELEQQFPKVSPPPPSSSPPSSRTTPLLSPPPLSSSYTEGESEPFVQSSNTTTTATTDEDNNNNNNSSETNDNNNNNNTTNSRPPQRRYYHDQQQQQQQQYSLRYYLSIIQLYCNKLIHIIYIGLYDFKINCKQLYTKELYNITLPLQMVWFSLSFGSYGLSTWINTIFVTIQLENIYFNALLFACSNLPGNIISGIWMDTYGRSFMLSSSILLAAISLLLFAYYANSNTNTTDDDDDDGHNNNNNSNTFGIVLSACAFQAFSIASWNTIDCMSSELFPTKVRSTGLGVCAATGRIGAMIAQVINGILIVQPVRLLLVSSITLLIGASTPIWLPKESDLTGQPVHDTVENNNNNSNTANNDNNIMTTNTITTTANNNNKNQSNETSTTTTAYSRMGKNNTPTTYQEIV